MLFGAGAPGWPVVLTDGPVVLRPYRRSDGQVWADVRRRNEQWLAQWEPTPYGSWHDLNSPAAFRAVYADLRRSARQGAAMPFAVCYEEELVGQLTLGNIVRRAFCSAYAGYWVDSAVAGKGVIPTALALAVDHAFRAGGLHRIEINIRPENKPSLRVVEKLGLRDEGVRERFLHIQGQWRDHRTFAVTREEVPEGLLARWQRLRDAP
jgi:ribosomal-protein-alanine N-acetyltransferase